MFITICEATVKTHPLFWNRSNPIFHISNTDHIMDVNVGNQPWEYDQLQVICPSAGNEKYIIYSVDKEEYDMYRITKREPKIVAVCDQPDAKLQFTITFRSFSPTPRGLEFQPGHDYYFISTSMEDDLHLRAGGSCLYDNMRVIIKIANKGRLRESKRPEEKIISMSNLRTKQISKPIEEVASFHNKVYTSSNSDSDENVREEDMLQVASTMSFCQTALVSPLLIVLLIFL